MKAIYNSRILPLEKISLEIHNRAFCYGDGLFETIVAGPGRISLTQYHIARLRKAGGILDIQIPFDDKLLREMIATLKKENGIHGTYRVRLQVWRDQGGLYTPEKNSTSYLITIAESSSDFYGRINSLSLSKNAKVAHHSLSFAKTMSAMPYILAGLEKKQGPHEDLIITDALGHVAETIASNLFWIKQNKIYTPALASGCVAGTLRAYLLDEWAKIGTEVHEVMAQIEDVLGADALFTTNAAGIRWVGSYEGEVQYSNPQHLLNQFF